jgi:hypothetical protein
MVRRAAPELTPEQKRSRALKIVGFGCGGAIVLVLLIVIVVYILARSTPPVPRELQEALAAQKGGGGQGGGQAPDWQTQPGAAGGPGSAAPGTPMPAAPPADQQFEQLKQAARAGQTGTFQMSVTEADLNAQLMRDAGKGGFTGAAVAFLEGEIVSTGTGQWGGQTLQAMVRARPSIEGGRPRLIITEAYLGRLPAPGEAVGRMQAELDKAIDKALADARGARITNVTVQRGRIIVDGYLTGSGQ